MKSRFYNLYVEIAYRSDCDLNFSAVIPAFGPASLEPYVKRGISLKPPPRPNGLLRRLAAALTLCIFLSPVFIYYYVPRVFQAQYYLSSFALLLPGSLVLLLVDRVRSLHRRRVDPLHSPSASDVQSLPRVTPTLITRHTPLLITSQERILQLENPPIQMRLHKRIIAMLIQVATDPLVLSRLAVFSLIIIAPLLVALPPKGLTPVTQNVAVPSFFPAVRWDSYWYLRVAKEGYTTVPGFQAIAFRPLFPLIMRLLYPLLNLKDHRAAMAEAGIAWNLVAVIIAGVYLDRLTKILLGTNVARRTLLLLAVYPSTFFLSVLYSEATAFLLIVTSIYTMETKKPLFAGGLGFLAGLARPETFLLSGAYLVKGIVTTGEDWTKTKILLASGMTALSLPVFLFYSYLISGSFMTPARVEASWQKCSLICFMNNPERHFFSPTNTWPFAINILVMIISIAFIAGAFVRVGAANRVTDRMFPYYLWGLALLGIVFYVAEVRSWARFQLGIPAVFWAQARFGVSHPNIFYLFIGAYAFLMMTATVLFANWYPML